MDLKAKIAKLEKLVNENKKKRNKKPRDLQGTELQHFHGKLMHPNEIKRLQNRPLR